MGCDIHPYIEQKIQGKWVFLDNIPDQFEDYDVFHISNRNYNVFAILADVRNGRGFAGIKTGEGFHPISPPRGLPNDVSEALKKAINYPEDSGPWLGDHSHSWLTFAEIFNYDYTQTTTLTGVIGAEEFRSWDFSEYSRKRGPRSWSGDVSGGSTTHISNAQMRTLLTNHTHGRLPEEFDKYYTRIEWTRSYFDCMWHFLYALKWLVPDGVRHEDLRLVFGFDN